MYLVLGPELRDEIAQEALKYPALRWQTTLAVFRQKLCHRYTWIDVIRPLLYKHIVPLWITAVPAMLHEIAQVINRLRTFASGTT